ncbi:MAG: hypothetical protein IPG31_11710 [Nitrosomonas sp.]|nr:hypothetical protein [Nitrosomonas sp.]
MLPETRYDKNPAKAGLTETCELYGYDKQLRQLFFFIKTVMRDASLDHAPCGRIDQQFVGFFYTWC